MVEGLTIVRNVRTEFDFKIGNESGNITSDNNGSPLFITVSGLEYLIKKSGKKCVIDENGIRKSFVRK